MAGVDVHYVGDLGVGAVAVVDYDSLEVLETSVAACPLRMPYVSTLLSFRELPPTMVAINQLSLQPDVFLVDAQGWAHPYRCGFACHLGLALRKPTVGAAKSRLTGSPVRWMAEPCWWIKARSLGEAVVTRKDVKPVYVSVGHMVTLETAVNVVRHLIRTRIPEPLRQAHKLAVQKRLELFGEAK